MLFNAVKVLFVVPELDLAVVSTGGNYGQGGLAFSFDIGLASPARVD